MMTTVRLRQQGERGERSPAVCCHEDDGAALQLVRAAGFRRGAGRAQRLLPAHAQGRHALQRASPRARGNPPHSKQLATTRAHPARARIRVVRGGGRGGLRQRKSGGATAAMLAATAAAPHRVASRPAALRRTLSSSRGWARGSPRATARGTSTSPAVRSSWGAPLNGGLSSVSAIRPQRCHGCGCC